MSVLLQLPWSSFVCSDNREHLCFLETNFRIRNGELHTDTVVMRTGQQGHLCDGSQQGKFAASMGSATESCCSALEVSNVIPATGCTPKPLQRLPHYLTNLVYADVICLIALICKLSLVPRELSYMDVNMAENEHTYTAAHSLSRKGIIQCPAPSLFPAKWHMCSEAYIPAQWIGNRNPL